MVIHYQGENFQEVIKKETIQTLIEKIRNIDWSSISDNKSGDRFNFSV